MANRYDSVDALMYAYYEMMRIKEENQMLKKNKDYVEFSLQYTSVDWERRSKDCPEVCLKGYSDFSFPGVPIMDVVCNEFDHKVVVVSKRDFEKLQTENKELKQKLHGFDPTPEFKELLKNLYSIEDVEKLEWFLNHVCGGLGSATGWRSIATFWKNRYNDLFKLIGFSAVEEIEDYLVNEAECDTLHEAIYKLIDESKHACEKWCNANSSNNSWKAAAECNTPKELIEKLNLLRDDISGRSTVIEAYKRDIEKWQKATGCINPEDISAESMISKSMANEITTANEELWSENEKCEKRIEALLSEIREWRETTGCPSPSSAKTLIESGASWHHAFNEAKEKNRKLIKEVDSWEHVTGFSSPEDYEGGWQKIRRLCEAIYKSNDNGEREQEWREGTGCPGPIAAKALIESGMAYEHGYHESQEENRKLTEEVDSWKNVTGYSTPEDYMHARISGAFHTPFDYTAAWQKATGCNTPEAAKKRISGLISEDEAWESDYNHLLALTGFDNEGEIEDFLEQNNDRNKLTTVIDNLKLENETMKTALRASNRAMLKGLDQEIDKWQKATGRTDPEAAKQYIDRLKGRLNKIHGYSVDW